jgi:hypothetical protein
MALLTVRLHPRGCGRQRMLVRLVFCRGRNVGWTVTGTCCICIAALSVRRKLLDN